MFAGFDQDRRRFLKQAAVTAAAARLGTLAAALPSLACSAPAHASSNALTSLRGATGWLNSPPLAPDVLSGRVVLVDFCTYTCINWLRSLPYVRAWSERYQQAGLVVIGAHTPEFSFERDTDNVRRALAELRVSYPVAIDNEYAIWNGFHNRYWPAVYLVDARGQLRFRHFGEGEYEETEDEIRRLLTEAGGRGVPQASVPIHAEGVEAAADWRSLKSPETYLGYARTARFASPGGVAADERRGYLAPPMLGLNSWALAGQWTIGEEAAVLDRENGRLAYRFHARDLHLVAGPVSPGASVRFQVRIDGQPPGSSAGRDVDADGTGRLTAKRMYQLVRQPGPIADRTFEIEFLEQGAAAFAFTFG